MATDFNKGKAMAFYEELNGTHATHKWLEIIAKCVGFLLARYIDGK